MTESLRKDVYKEALRARHDQMLKKRQGLHLNKNIFIQGMRQCYLLLYVLDND